ncbi:MAG: hypothetical protein QUV35_04180 [Hydrogenophaga sp.]|uniref:hypothetical protein n=1 Tax=Hydrogenophaga sp. TaxID=1904254 RepID=UPI0026331988|nr:hypothetical protein [Hydrogenophaga sp.]MDM7941805.1 hypothetical protein [Hydrogenophaga sp.]
MWKELLLLHLAAVLLWKTPGVPSWLQFLGFVVCVSLSLYFAWILAYAWTLIRP